MRNKSSVVLLIILCALLGGCSAKYVGKSYDGPDLPNTEVGTVKFNDLEKMFNNQAVVPGKVDGVRVDMNPKDRTVTVKPGMHTFCFMYDGKGPLVTVEWSFNVEAGHTYLITFPPEQSASGIALWLEDLTLGKRVTDVTSSPLKGAFSCF
jgi:hypothetical protein